jgi:hypothetical protein
MVLSNFLIDQVVVSSIPPQVNNPTTRQNPAP